MEKSSADAMFASAADVLGTLVDRAVTAAGCDQTSNYNTVVLAGMQCELSESEYQAMFLPEAHGRSIFFQFLFSTWREIYAVSRSILR